MKDDERFLTPEYTLATAVAQHSPAEPDVATRGSTSPVARVLVGHIQVRQDGSTGGDKRPDVGVERHLVLLELRQKCQRFARQTIDLLRSGAERA